MALCLCGAKCGAPEWTFIEFTGAILHTCNCDVCSSYQHHFGKGGYSGSPSHYCAREEHEAHFNNCHHILEETCNNLEDAEAKAKAQVSALEKQEITLTMQAQASAITVTMPAPAPMLALAAPPAQPLHINRLA
ncbi:hypothetical protein SERLA73DRAFT_155405 [Serpula lacrymans var. lacrymans S7.3]|uniref:Uncharacterized protein n=1 Tax=Serpula lacrymans var. lacrymans (strain S7.3) TaxID=936435 RepID=F8Q9R8_SERL3|nr:hypothetical protein SERLA73DRAFT_155405 [Serpula lacrymans var. lacrymans S7.3]